MEREKKLRDLSDIREWIHDGDRIAIGGFAVYQRPMAIVREIVRQGIKDLTIVGIVNSMDADLLIGAGCVSVIETSYVGLEKYGLALNYRRAVQEGTIKVKHYPEMLAWDRFRADREGWPYWPVYYLSDCDIVLRNPDIIEYSCPMTGKPVHALPAAKPDVVLLHAYKSDIYGNLQLQPRWMLPQIQDVDLARACDRVIATVEHIVDTEEIKKHPERTQVPAFKTKAIFDVNYGSHPTMTLDCTKEDVEAFSEYAEASKSKESFDEYLKKYIYDVKDNDEYLSLFGKEHLERLEDSDNA